MNEDILGQLVGPPQGPTKFKVGKIEAPQPTYFYKQPFSGKAIAVGASEAWNLHKKGWEQIGYSDGSKYATAVAEAHKIYNDELMAFKKSNPGVLISEEIKQEALMLAQERIRRAFDEELESARGNVVVPQNADYFGSSDAIDLIKK